MNHRLLFLGADAAAIDAINYAKSQGVYTIVTDYYSYEQSEAKQLADEYWMINVADVDELEKKCIEREVTAIFSGIHEFCIDKCKELCKRLDLPFYASDEAWRSARDKAYYKSVCRECGLDVPVRYKLTEALAPEDVERIHFPVIVKPNDSCAQQGLSLVHQKSDLEQAYRKALSYSASKDIIVEDYIAGDELYLFCYIHDGKVSLMGMAHDTMIEMNGRKMFCFGMHQGPFNEYIEEVMLPKFEKLAERLGCVDGACVFQCIHMDGKIYNIEFGYRLDGVLSYRVVNRRFGFDQLQLMVDLAMGIKPTSEFWNSAKLLPGYEASVGYSVWCKPGEIEKIEGRETIYSRDDIVILIDRFKAGDVAEAGDNMRAIAFNLAVFADTHEELDAKIKEISGALRIYDKQGNDLLVHIDNYLEQRNLHLNRCHPRKVNSMYS